jgi:hypothetical protein
MRIRGCGFRVDGANSAWRVWLSWALLAAPLTARAAGISAERTPIVGDRGEVPSRHGPGERRNTLPALDAKLFDAAQRGCKKNDQTSCVKLGRYLEEGVATSQDKPRALGLYRGACDRGFVRGCVHVAIQLIDNAYAKAILGGGCCSSSLRPCSFSDKRAPRRIRWVVLSSLMSPPAAI